MIVYRLTTNQPVFVMRKASQALAALGKSECVQFSNLRELFARNPVKGVPRKLIYSDLLHLVVPAAIEYVLLQFVGMFDQIQVGVLGEHALSAVGLSSQIRVLLMTVFQGINVGVTALVARSVGQGKQEDFFIILRQGIKLCIIAFIPLVVISIVFLDGILTIFNCPSEQARIYAYDYLRISIIFSLPAFITMSITAALRGAGDARTPLFYNVLANVLNVFLNWVMITGKLGFPRLEVKGAAIATIISQTVAAVIAVAVVLSRKRRASRWHIPKEHGSDLKLYTKGIVVIGLPTMFEQFVMRIGMAMFTSIAASLGPTLYAAHAVSLNIQQLTFMSGMAFSVASTTLAGQSVGAGRKDMAVVYTWYCAKLCLGFSLILSAVYAFLGSKLIAIYTTNTAIIQAGIIPLRMVAFTQPLIAFQYVFGGAFKGNGDTKATAIIGIISSFICRPLFAYLGVYVWNLGLVGAWIGLAVDQALCSCLLINRFISCKWLHAMDSFEIKRRKSNEQ